MLDTGDRNRWLKGLRVPIAASRTGSDADGYNDDKAEQTPHGASPNFQAR
jgi:hypothetical protein